MPLKPGGPCVALLRPTGAQEAPTECGKTEAHLWYAGPTCKSCYEKKKRKRSGSADVPCPDEDDQPAGDTLLEIIKIYQIRRAPWPCPLLPISHLLTACVPFCAVPNARALCARIAARPSGVINRSNPVAIGDEALEYDVYGWFNFDGVDAEGVRRLGRQWVPVEAIAAVSEWSEKEDEFDARVRELRAPFADADSESN